MSSNATITKALRDLKDSSSSEDHAMFECIQDGLDGVPTEERIELAMAMADTFIESAQAFKRTLSEDPKNS